MRRTRIHTGRHLLAVALALALAVSIQSPAFAAPKDAQTRSASANADVSTITQAATRVVAGTRELGLFALSLVGIDYRFGGDSPERGLDCSGLIRYVFQQVTGVTLPRTAQELSRMGEKVRAEDLAPGDLVFFNTRRFAFSHVGIYLGDGRFIHAPARGREVGVATLSNAYWQKRYNGARRLLGVLPALMPALISPAMAQTLPRTLDVQTSLTREHLQYDEASGADDTTPSDADSER